MKHCKPAIRVCLLLTGNEIMTGDIVDSNSTFMSQQLTTIGLKVEQKIAIGDDFDLITSTMVMLSKQYDLIIMNGGLGATVDDLTAEAAAKITGKKLVEHPVAIENIKSRFGEAFLKENPSYLEHVKKQAVLPEDVEIVPNPVGLAVGFKIHLNNAVFYFTPGVPREMKAMVSDHILPDIKKVFSLDPSYFISKFQVSGIGESKMQQLIHRSFPSDFWEKVELGFRASTGVVEVKFSTNDPSALPELEKAEELFKSIAPAESMPKGKSIQQHVVDLLRENQNQLMIIDGCTGGRLVQSIDDIPESSAVLRAGLQISDPKLFELLMEDLINGTASKLTQLVGSDIAEEQNRLCFLLVSPHVDGNITVFWGNNHEKRKRDFLIRRDRETVQRCVSIASIDMLRRFLLDLDYSNPYYFDELTRKALR